MANKIIDIDYLKRNLHAFENHTLYRDVDVTYYKLCDLQDGTQGKKVVTTVTDEATEILLSEVNTQTTPVDLTGLVGDGSEYVEQAITLMTQSIYIPRAEGMTRTEITEFVNDIVAGESNLYLKTDSEDYITITEHMYEFESYTTEEVNGLFDATDDEIDFYSSLINDELISANRLWTSQKINDTITQSTLLSQQYADTVIGGISSIKIEYVTALPDAGDGSTIYILASTDDNPDTLNLYSNGSWNVINDSLVEFVNYYTKTETDSLLDLKADKTSVLAIDNVVQDLTSTSSSTVLSTQGIKGINDRLTAAETTLNNITTEPFKKEVVNLIIPSIEANGVATIDISYIIQDGYCLINAVPVDLGNQVSFVGIEWSNMTEGTTITLRVRNLTDAIIPQTENLKLQLVLAKA